MVLCCRFVPLDFHLLGTLVTLVPIRLGRLMLLGPINSGYNV
jgi:hypothetical protein